MITKKSLGILTMGTLLSALVACGGDDDAGDGGSGGAGASGGQGGAGATTSTGGTGGTGGGGGMGGAGGSGMVTVSGTVTIEGPNGPEAASGAVVNAVGTAIETTVGSDGTYELTVPLGVVALHASRAPDWGVIEVVDFEKAPLTGNGLVLATEAELTMIGQDLGTATDPDDALVVVLFNGAAGGETVTLDLASDVTFIEQNDTITSASSLPAGSGLMGFLNVAPGTTTITVTGTSTTCTLNVPAETEFPVIAKTATFAFADCVPQ
jgi:hypothetical protein